ncbi:uncharacterized protein LOC128554777, partial [Mercenaria mercenaria]|uniref:uncharacterized protein LOC128554777 n=1 Tax=Mercenaria mercenaria TaxID=6596 RepID=UPI00234ED7B1
SDPPSDLKTTVVSSRSITISWNAPNNTDSEETFGYVFKLMMDDACVKEVVYRCSNCLGTFQISSLENMCENNNVREVHSKTKIELSGLQSYEFINLPPYTTFIISGTAVNYLGRGNVASILQATAEEAPQTPYNVDVRDIGTTSFTITWNIDGPRPGKTHFTITLIADHPAANKEFTVTDFTARSYLAEGLEEYWNYSVTVTVVTSVGAKTSDKSQTYRTKPAAPGTVLNVEITGALGGIYTLMQISWKAPAVLRRNSLIKEYSLVTNSTGTNAKKQSLSHESKENYEYEIVVNVIPEETYTFQVYAINLQDMKGVVTTVEKQAPVGVPVNIEDTLQVDILIHQKKNVGKRQFTVSLVRNFFEESTNGQIQASGLIACVKDCKFEGIRTLSDFNTMDNWKKSSLKGFTLYRVTNSTWLDEMKTQCSRDRRKRSVTKVEYTVGSDDCTDVSSEEYCNGPLQLDTSYYLVAVSCTNGGCLLSRQYGPFVATSEGPCTTENDSSTHSIIIGAVLGVIILILIVYAGYATFLIRRYRQNGGKEINTSRKKNDRKSQTYVNEAVVLGVVDARGSTNDRTLSNIATSEEPYTEYSRLDDNKRDDRTGYDIIHSSRQY